MANKIQPTNQSNIDYLNIPNAKKSEIGELNQHLFFTVQVGVYNKPIRNDQLKQFDDLVTFKTEKGQIRYSSGMFENVNDVKIHKNQAVAKGVADAFVVAYYQGKRISIAEATNFLAKNGPDILKKSTQNQQVEGDSNRNISGSIVDLTIELPEVINRIKSDSIVQYTLTCSADEVISKLEKMNRIGIFTYQNENGKIVSAKMQTDEIAKIQKEYLKEFQIENEQMDSTLLVQLDVTNKLSNGSFTDWLLRSNLSYRIENKEERKILNLYLVNEFQNKLVLKKAGELSISIINE
jgi:hypothetical protein